MEEVVFPTPHSPPPTPHFFITMKQKLTYCIVILSLFFTFSVFSQAATEKPKKKNVVIMIGDGMGLNTHVAGSYWRFGELGKQPVDSFPVQLGMTTFEVKPGVDAIPDGVKGYDLERFWKNLDGANVGTEFTQTTDSASAATAIYTGQKTTGGRMGVTQDGKPLKLLSDYAAETNIRTGVVSTVQLSHATPGAFGSHNVSRGNYAEIFNEILFQSNLTVLFGAGHPFYINGNPIAMRDGEKKAVEYPVSPEMIPADKTWEEFCAENWDFQYIGGIETAKRLRLEPLRTLDNVRRLGGRAGVIPTDTKVGFNQWAENGLSRYGKMRGDVPAQFRFVGVARSRDNIPPIDGAPDDPEAEAILLRKLKNTNFDELPTLSTMSLAALKILSDDAALGDSNGFTLMIEGGAIDWANHGNDIEQSIMEHTGFMKAVETVIEWVEKNSSWDETLLIVTADHETGGMWGPGTFEEVKEGEETKRIFHEHKPLVNNGKGRVPGVQYSTGGHTNTLVPFWAKGRGAEEFPKKVRGTDQKAGDYWGNASKFGGKYIDNTDIAPVILSL